MRWFNEPASWSKHDGVLDVTADGQTDFWRVTGNGKIRDNGHLYGTRVRGDFCLSMSMEGSYHDETDHAGAMVRLNSRSWVKTGVELFEGRIWFSTVVTNDFSSWAVAELPKGFKVVNLELSRHAEAVEVRYSVDDVKELGFASRVYFPADCEVVAGAMCAAPQGDGFPVTFRDLAVSSVL